MELKSQFAKAYSKMSQAVILMQNDFGDLNSGTYYGAETISGPDFRIFAREYFPCESIPPSTFFKSNPCGTGKNSYKNYSQTTCPYVNLAGAGMIICKTTDNMLLFAHSWNNRGLTMSVDVNGWEKQPNRWGYDLFTFAITSKNSRLVTAGGASPRSAINYYPCTKQNIVEERYNGAGCSYYALIDKNPDDATKKYWESLD